ncbi:hypothetical protein K8Q98_02210, partial [Candidatus Nomurabacteria bacterium]|nr:hypothetical protein [Candidatus Nomurabacteria bacterium]
EEDLIKELLDRHSEFREKIVEIERKTPRLYILSLYESIINNLEALLVPYVGLAVRKISPFEIIKLAVAKKIITSKEENIVRDLRGVRNQIAHSQFPEDKKIPEDFLSQVEKILNNLEQSKDNTVDKRKAS